MDVLREFQVDVEPQAETDHLYLGRVTGWIGWRIAQDDVHDAADAISVDAKPLGAAAAQIIEELPGHFIDSVLLVDRMHLEPDFRGRRLTGAIISHLLARLRMQRNETVVVMPRASSLEAPWTTPGPQSGA